MFYGFQTASKLPTESHAMPAALNKLSFLLLLYAAVSACIFQFVLPDLSADWSVWSAATAFCALHGFIVARRLRRGQDASPAGIGSCLTGLLIAVWLMQGMDILIYADYYTADYRIPRDRLSTIEFTVPKAPECSGGNRVRVCYLPAAEDLHLYCQTVDKDSCARAYRHAGQTARVRYHGGRLYEMSVGNTAVYRYEEQTAVFEREQSQLCRQPFALLLFTLPLIWFVRRYKRLARKREH